MYLRTLALFVASSVFLAPAATVRADIIIVPNYSFESPVSGSFNSGPGSVDSWTVANAFAGIFNPAGTELTFSLPPNTYFNSGFPTDGQQSAYLGATSSLTTTASLGTITANTLYTLTVDVGARKDAALVPYTIALLAGGTPEATFVDSTGTSVSAGNWATETVTLTVGASSPLIGQALGIEFFSSGSGSSVQVNFDNVHLTSTSTVTPEPATLGSLCLGILSMVAYRWRRRSA